MTWRADQEQWTAHMTTPKHIHPDNAVPLPIAVRISEASRLTGLGKTKLYALMASGDLAKVKIGGATLIPMKSLEALLEQGSRL